MDQNSTGEEGKMNKHGFEFVKSVSDKHLDVLVHCFSVLKGHTKNNEDCEKERYTLIMDEDGFQQGFHDEPLPCFGCGVGWFS